MKSAHLQGGESWRHLDRLQSSGEQPLRVLPLWARKEHATKHARATNTVFEAYMPGGEEGHAARSACGATCHFPQEGREAMEKSPAKPFPHGREESESGSPRGIS